MRLIDGNKLYDIEKLLNTDIIQSSKEASWLMSQILYDINSIPTIDPETLPIVQELKKNIKDLMTNLKKANETTKYWYDKCNEIVVENECLQEQVKLLKRNKELLQIYAEKSKIKYEELKQQLEQVSKEKAESEKLVAFLKREIKVASLCYMCQNNGVRCHIDNPRPESMAMCVAFEWRGIQEVKDE